MHSRCSNRRKNKRKGTEKLLLLRAFSLSMTFINLNSTYLQRSQAGTQWLLTVKKLVKEIQNDFSGFQQRSANDMIHLSLKESGEQRMNNEELQHLTEKLSLEFFGKPFEHCAYFNNRLQTTGGRYALRSHNIDINPKHLEYYGVEEVINIIKHELCHYHLHIEGKGYQHRDREFKELLQMVGGARHCQSIPYAKKAAGKIHIYQCSGCRHEYTRKRRMNIKKYVCGKCHGSLKKIAEKDLSKTLTPTS